MKLLVCADTNVQTCVDFWNSVPDVDTVSVVCQVTDLSGVIGTDETPDVLIARLPHPGLANAEVLSAMQRIAQGIPIIAWVGAASAAGAFNLCYLGADELITDDASLEDRASAITMARVRRQGMKKSDEPEAGVEAEPWRRRLVGGSCSMRVVTELIRLVSARRATVLITGETGTGKE